MPSFETLVGLQQALAAIDVMIRSGKGRGGNLASMAREASTLADRLAAHAARRRDVAAASAPSHEQA
ncbi:hypothetical protein [Phreatobacter oligotrophus]|uniref:hypothetical protein n=1 Tax=Phreatobacter oligotrophus TaxID=1122261 RepID=UPI002352F305|nr:hypothetical protein [Phreatobacter oligotrophus]MBX9991070.1 hypothetical protein [Phreatobacter oligotrophus]